MRYFWSIVSCSSADWLIQADSGTKLVLDDDITGCLVQVSWPGWVLLELRKLAGLPYMFFASDIPRNWFTCKILIISIQFIQRQKYLVKRIILGSWKVNKVAGCVVLS